MDDFENYETAQSGVSATVPIQCSALRKGQYAMLNGFPCKIVEMSTSKTGKHGHAKVHLVGHDIFTGKKCEDLCPSTHKMDTPVITRKDYTYVGQEDGFLCLMDDTGCVKETVRIPTDETICKQIQEAVDDDNTTLLLTVICFDQQEMVVAVKKC